MNSSEKTLLAPGFAADSYPFGRSVRSRASGALGSLLLVALIAQADGGRAVEHLERVGLALARQPCPEPLTKTWREAHLFDEDILVQWTKLSCPSVDVELVSSSRTSFRTSSVNNVIVRSSDSRVPEQFRVGADIEGVRRALGAPYRDDGRAINYEATSGGASIMFVHDGQSITMVRWLWPRLD